MTIAIALTMMVAGIVSVALECAVAGLALLGGAMLLVRYFADHPGSSMVKRVPSASGPLFPKFPKTNFNEDAV